MNINRNQRFQAIEFVDRHSSEKLQIKSFLIFLRKTCVASITQRFLVQVSTVSQPEIRLYFRFVMRTAQIGPDLRLTVSARTAWHNDLLLQPRSQSSSAISDVTSPVNFVGKIRSRYRARFQASSNHSDSANRPGYEAVPFVS